MKKVDGILEDLAKFFFSIFRQNYSENFVKYGLLAGGGGNSMLMNAWIHPSASFIRKRISGEAKKRIVDHGYSSLKEIPHSFLRHNAKGSKNRIAAGKQLHEDHNPSNKKVMQLIMDKVRSYATSNYDEHKDDLMNFLKNVQTLDIITVEQDDLRTNKDEIYTKKQKDMFTHQERDDILNDTWEYI